jgi:gamma-glutamylcyclotransferase
VSISYFAYGSNMAADVITRVCPRHRFLGVACLADHRLAFTRRSRRTGTGVADVVATPGSIVWGTLYEVEDDELAAVDRKEGYDWAYTRIVLPVRLAAVGPELMATVYTVRVKEPTEIPPSHQYLELLIAAGRARGLPEAYVAWITATFSPA